MLKKISVSLLFGLLLIAVYFGLRSHTFLASIVHDDGIFLYGGQAWASGYLPFQGFWDHKPPGIFFYHSLPLRIFPFSLFAVKFHQLLWLAGGAVLLYCLCRKHFSRPASALTVALYVIYTSLPQTIRTGGFTEEDALFFVILAYYLASLRRWSWWIKALLSGVAVGIAIQFRQTFLFSLILVLATFAWQWFDGRFSLREGLLSTALALLGLLIPELLVSLYFLLHGSWFQYFEASYLFNLYYVNGRPHHTWWEWVRIQENFIRNTGPFLLAPLFPLLTWQWIPSRLRWMLLALTFQFGCELFAISLSGEYYSHYYVQATVTMVLLFALFFEGLYRRYQLLSALGFSVSTAGIAGLYALLLLSLFAVPMYWGVKTYISDYRSILAERNRTEGEYAFQHGVAAAVAQLTAPEDTILLIGRMPNSVYMLAGRHAGSRYFHYSPLWKEKLAVTVQERHVQQLQRDINRRRPALLLFDLTRLRNGPLSLIEDHTPELLPFIKEHYAPLEDVLEIDPEERWFWYNLRLTLWVRKDQAEEIQRRAVLLGQPAVGCASLKRCRIG